MANIASAFKKNSELQRKIIFTLISLVVYRVGCHIPTPGVDAQGLSEFLKSQAGGFFTFFNMFSGGALAKFSVFALGIMPYISASIIFQLLTVISPTIEELQKEGESGRKKINQWTRYATAGLALMQGFGIASGLETFRGVGNAAIVLIPGFQFKIITALTLCAGTCFLMWLGEQMTERGIGNGTSVIIFAGIAASIPTGMFNMINLYNRNQINMVTIIAVLAVMVLVIAGIIFFERAQRRIPIHHSKRSVGGNKIIQPTNTHMPLKINVSGVIPPIFASSLLMFPSFILRFLPKGLGGRFMQFIQDILSPGGVFYNLLYVLGIIFFGFFYTTVVFKTKDVSENINKNGGYIPGVRPGPRTAQFLDYIINRLTVGGVAYLCIICVLPVILANQLKVPFQFGGTSILILVGVALDTVAQIETHLFSAYYDGFIKNVKIKGRR